MPVLPGLSLTTTPAGASVPPLSGAPRSRVLPALGCSPLSGAACSRVLPALGCSSLSGCSPLSGAARSPGAPRSRVLPGDSQRRAEVSLREEQLQRPKASVEVTRPLKGTGGPPANVFFPEPVWPTGLPHLGTRPVGLRTNATSQRQKPETVLCPMWGKRSEGAARSFRALIPTQGNTDVSSGRLKAR